MTKNGIEPQTVNEAEQRSVSVAEPYELPAGWKWVRGDELFEPMESIQPIGETFDYIDIDAIDNANQIVTSPKVVATENAPSRASRKLHSGDTVFSMVRPYLKNIAYIDESLSNAIASTGFFVCTPKNFADKRYVYNLMKSPYVVDGLNAFMKGDNSPSIRKTDIENYPFPLPPTLAEQKRIVSRIESLFTKLEKAKDSAQSVLDGFELRRAAVLHKAFTNQLKIENGELKDEDWEEKSFSELGTANLGKMLDANKNTGDDVQYLRNVNVRWFDFDLSDLMTMKAKPEEIKKLSVKKGDLFICEGGEPGRCAVWKNENVNMIFQKAIHRFRPNENVSSDFVAYELYYLNQIGKLSEYFTGTTIKHLTGQSLAKVPIRIPPLNYQLSIVNFLDTVLEKESRAKEAAGAVLDQIDLLKKSILARAFRGKL